MPAWEVPLWEAFYEVEPWGEDQMDFRFAALWAKVHNVSPAGVKPVQSVDAPFESLKSVKAQKQSPEAMRRALNVVVAMGRALGIKKET